MKKILLIITGSIAAYKGINLIRKLEDTGYLVTVILTKGGEQFISPLTISSLARALVYKDDVFQDPMLHIKLARENDIILVIPASANFIAKATYGFADSLSLAVILAANIPIVFAPAMNPLMYNSQATQTNLNLLKSRNYQIWGPDYGIVACKEKGLGKCISENEVVSRLEGLNNGKLKGKKAVITLGSTREKIDPVRFIGNYSSGKQGMLIAEELEKQGCEVQIIAGFTEVLVPKNATRAYNAGDMLAASLAALPADIYISVAAICDFKPKNYANDKIKKTEQNIILELEPNIDVVLHVAKHHSRPNLVVGFALESNNYEDNAIKKLQNKNLDMVVLNKSNMMQQEENEFVLYSQKHKEEFGLISKQELARKLVDELMALLTKLF